MEEDFQQLIVTSESDNKQQIARIQDLPPAVLQTKILGGWFNSKELFKLRAVCGEWSDAVKQIWCHTVKEEMLE